MAEPRLGFMTFKTDRDVVLQVPEQADPSAVSSIVDALQEALSVIVLTGQAPVIDQADRLATLATGVLRPNGELLESRIRRLKTLREIFDEGEWLSSEDLNALQPSPSVNKSLPGSDWKRRGRIFSVNSAGREYFARYQFDSFYQPLPAIRDILKAFGPVADPWVLAAWFHYPNGWLTNDDGVPIAPKDALDRPQDVENAARQRRESYVA